MRVETSTTVVSSSGPELCSLRLLPGQPVHRFLTPFSEVQNRLGRVECAERLAPFAHWPIPFLDPVFLFRVGSSFFLAIGGIKSWTPGSILEWQMEFKGEGGTAEEPSELF